MEKINQGTVDKYATHRKKIQIILKFPKWLRKVIFHV